MAYLTEEELGFREDYKGEILQSLEKVRSPRRVEFIIEPTDKKDRWFVQILEYQKKSGEMKNTSMITMDDYPEFVERYCRILGFHKVD